MRDHLSEIRKQRSEGRKQKVVRAHTVRLFCAIEIRTEHCRDGHLPSLLFMKKGRNPTALLGYSIQDQRSVMPFFAHSSTTSSLHTED